MNFSNVNDWNIPEGEVIRVTDSLNRVIWEKEYPTPTDYFWIKDVSGSNNTVTIKKVMDSDEHWITPTITVYYSTDQINWTSMGSTSTTGITVTIPANTKVYFRATADTWSSNNTNYHNFFDISGNCTVGGNVMSLIYGNNFANQTAFPNNSKCNLAEILAGNPIINASLLILPATTLTESCYYGMFINCYNLAAAPELPATTLARQCYQLMFAHCTSLTTAPVLPATTLVDSCYSSMFGSCYALNTVTTYADDISATNCLSNWLLSVAATGNFYNYGSASYQIDSGNGIPTGWTEHNYVPFYVEDISGSDNTLSIVKSREDAPTVEVFKSGDGINWSTMGTTDTTAITATVPANGKLYLKATTNRWGSDYVYNTITVNGNHNVGGNIMSLLYGDNYGSQTSFPSGSTYNFNYLFNNNRNLVNASKLILPATTLTQSCYKYMFSNCRALTTAPVLPATTLANYCYNGMFSYCQALTTAPELPAITLAQSCYASMFMLCSALTTAPVLPATTLTSNCYSYMFDHCTSLTTAPELPATTLASNCYNSMFSSCTSLTTAPVLPATTLVNFCYYAMFYGCTSLNSVTTYADDISATNCLGIWLDGVSSTGDFYNYGNATYPSGASGIPTGWTEHTNPNI